MKKIIQTETAFSKAMDVIWKWKTFLGRKLEEEYSVTWVNQKLGDKTATLEYEGTQYKGKKTIT